MTGPASWTNIDRQGRRMSTTIKLCETMIEKYLKAGKDDATKIDHDIILAYMDRMIKASVHQSHLTDMKLNLKLLRRLAEKKYLEQITEIKLKELA